MSGFLSFDLKSTPDFQISVLRLKLHSYNMTTLFTILNQKATLKLSLSANFMRDSHLLSAAFSPSMRPLQK